MRIAVVILNWNGRYLLEQFLPSVIEYSKEATVYVADNASEDDSVEFVKRSYPGVQVIQNSVNGGFAKGYNDALSQLDEDIFVLLNSDVEVSPNWLGPMLKEFKENPETAALQPKILDLKNREYFEYAGAAGGYIDKFGYPYCRGRIFDHLEKDKGQYDFVTEIFWASGACLAIRRADFNAAGKFDEDYFAHQEEIDLCWRIFNLGRSIKFIPDSKVYHLGGGTLNNMHPQKTYYNFRNSLFSLLKNVAGGKVIWIIFSRLVLDGLAGAKFLLEGRIGHTWAIVRAHFSFYGKLALFLKKRKKNMGGRKYYQNFSVICSYYFFKKRRFSEL